jgi:DNA-directed RNA polymerase subunit L
MKPVVSLINEIDNELTFTLSGVNVSIANAIRRVILSDIDIVVFKTSPNSENKSNFIINTTRYNNEILKQRLSCIPIHINDFSIIDDLELHVHCENNTNDIQYCTTEHFNVFNKKLNAYLATSEKEKIFPRNKITNEYIQFVRLRPKISDDIPGEEIKFTANMSISNARCDSMFNVACNSSYGFTWDKNKADDAWNTIEEELVNKGYDQDKIEFDKKDWYLLDAQRYYLPDSFDFKIESIGIFKSKQLIIKSCEFLINEFKNFKITITNDFDLIVKESLRNIDNCYDIKLQDKDYTFGKCLEYILFSNFYEKNELIFCGFQKKHPHDDYSIVSIAYPDEVNNLMIQDTIHKSCDLLIEVFSSIKNYFNK